MRFCHYSWLFASVVFINSQPFVISRMNRLFFCFLSFFLSGFFFYNKFFFDHLSYYSDCELISILNPQSFSYYFGWISMHLTINRYIFSIWTSAIIGVCKPTFNSRWILLRFPFFFLRIFHFEQTVHECLVLGLCNMNSEPTNRFTTK